MPNITKIARALAVATSITAPWLQQQANQTIPMVAAPTHIINPCEKPFSVDTIPFFPDGTWDYKQYSVSSGDLCCNLCYSSVINCVLADFNEFENKCLLKLNKVVVSEWPTEQCPLGVLDHLSLRIERVRKDFWGLMPGPCMSWG